ncbi:MAG: CRISPR-associated protein Cas4 [Fervidobacterium sp.]
MVNYYYICKRKLWLFSKGIMMENTSEKVLIGKLIHDMYYKKEKTKEILLDELIKIDILNKEILREIKTSSKMKEADIMQVAYYLYYLKQIGIEKTGEINYPKERKKETLELTKELEEKIEATLHEIKNITLREKPPKAERTKICRKCAYYEFCFGSDPEE